MFLGNFWIKGHCLYLVCDFGRVDRVLDPQNPTRPKNIATRFNPIRPETLPRNRSKSHVHIKPRDTVYKITKQRERRVVTKMPKIRFKTKNSTLFCEFLRVY